MASGPVVFPPFERPSGAFRLMWEGLHEAGSRLWPPAEWAMDDNSLRAIVGVQRAYIRHETAQRYAALLALCDAAAALCKRMLARLQSRACQEFAAWLTALPTTHALEQVRAAMQHRLDISPLPDKMRLVFGAAVTTAEDGNSTMVCTAMQGKATMKHDILSRILCRVIHRAGVASTLEPLLQWLPGLEAGAAATGEGFLCLV
jgi:hypothetical protein